MRTSYKVRIYPTPEQAAVLGRTFGCVRFVWNRTLAWRHARWCTERITTGFTQANTYLTAMKADADTAWLGEVSSVPLQQALRNQQVAFANFFAGRARYPRFKSRSGRQSAEYTRSAFRWREGRLFLAKMDAPLVYVWSWPNIDPASLNPSTVTVSRDSCGRWYASLVVDVAGPEQAPATGAMVGVDLGVKDFATTSDGEKIANPHHLARKAANLARYQRRMARKQSGTRLRHDRDINAAKNILAAGLAASACGGDVRHSGSPRVQSPMKQELQPARAGIPALQGGE